MFEGDIVVLSGAELSLAGAVGIARRIKAIFNKADPQEHDEEKGLWETDLVGAMAEYATAKYFNLGWSGAVIGNGVADVGGLIEARAVWEPYHRLIIRDSDVPKKHMPFVSVCADDNAFHLRGWMFGHEAMTGVKSDPTGRGRTKAWVIDNGKLNPMKQLRDWVEKNRPKLWQ